MPGLAALEVLLAWVPPGASGAGDQLPGPEGRRELED